MQTLVRTIESQQKLLEEQGRQLEQLRREMAEMRALVAPVPLSVAAVGVENRAAQSDAALHQTRQGTVNFIWSPIPRLDLVTEVLWGRRENKNGGHSFAAQTQIGSTFRF